MKLILYMQAVEDRCLEKYAKSGTVGTVFPLPGDPHSYWLLW